MIKVLSKQSFFIFFAIVFLLILFLDRKAILSKNNINRDVLMAGNTILFFATSISFVITYRSLFSTNVSRSVGSLYGSFMAKFFILAAAAFAYIMVAKKELNKPALFICMGLYLVYTFLEVASLQKILRLKKNERIAGKKES